MENNLRKDATQNQMILRFISSQILLKIKSDFFLNGKHLRKETI